MTVVHVSWGDVATRVDCADQFLVKVRLRYDATKKSPQFTEKYFSHWVKQTIDSVTIISENLNGKEF